jgi:redox-sensitive bicupin YhaK (pirin superfamily)
VHFLQIWILPERQGLHPSYQQRSVEREEKLGRLLLLCSPVEGRAPLLIHQDAEVHAALLEEGQSVAHFMRQGRHAWVQVARGGVMVNGHRMTAGDGAALSDEGEVEILASGSAEVLLFDLA